MSLPPQLGRNLVIVVALVTAGFFGAYLRFQPYLEHQASYTDGRRVYALDQIERLRFAIWGDPVPLPPSVNTRAAEGRPALSPDGRWLVFSVGEAGLNADLWVAEMVDGEPTHPRPLARLNTSADDLAPAFARDALYFASNRAGGRGGLDLMRAPWTDGVVGAAERLPPGLNTAADETDPAPVAGSRALAFASDRPRGQRRDHDVYIAVPRDAASDVSPLDGPDLSAGSAWHTRPFDVVNTPFEEREPAYAAGGQILIFSTDRQGAEGGFDLWHSMLSLGEWQPPRPLSGVNTADHERGPLLSPDGFELLFSVAADHDAGQLHRARSLELFRLPGRSVGWLDLSLLALLLLLALLAWLGRRWEALDILYKCLLVSLLVHLALMWWFRQVEVEHEADVRPERGRSFQVRIAPSRSVMARNRERAGALSPQRSEAEPAAEPERTTDLAPPSPQTGAATPTLADLAAQALADDAAAARLASADARRATGAASPGRETHEDVAVATPAASAARLSAEAPSLAMKAAPGPTRPAPTATTAEPTRATVVTTSARNASSTTPQPRFDAPLTRAAVAEGPQAPLAAPTTTPTTLPARGRSQAVAVDAPAAENAPREAGAAAAQETVPALDLGDLAHAAADADGRSAAASPQRWTRAAAGGPSALGGPSSAPAASSLPPVRAVADGASPPTSSPSPTAGPGRAAPALRAVTLDDTAAPGPRSDTEGERSLSEGAGSLTLEAVAVRAARREAGQGPPTRRALARESGTSPGLARLAPAFAPLGSVAVAPADLPLPAAPGSDWEETPYRTRFGEAKLQALREFGGNDETEAAVAAGLRYLASVQSEAGYWGDPRRWDDKYGRVTVGKTALCMLAFLGAGHTPASATEYSDVVRRAVDILLDSQDDATGHFGYTSSYSHAISTYALAECHALTGDASLRPPLQKAVDWILRHQERRRDDRLHGGWGYYYPDTRTHDIWPRTSITVWQIMALESARLGGLEVPDRAFDDARGFLRRAHRADRGVVLYNFDPQRLRSNYWTLPGSTPAGLFALSLLGDDIGSDAFDTAIDFIVERSPQRYAAADADAFVHEAEGNVYFWYYGSLALFRHGGPAWERWNGALQKTLLPAQRTDGSWRPISLYADYAGDSADDRAYTTAMCVLTLEVYYRYFTPLLKVR